MQSVYSPVNAVSSDYDAEIDACCGECFYEAHILVSGELFANNENSGLFIAEWVCPVCSAKTAIETEVYRVYA